MCNATDDPLYDTVLTAIQNAYSRGGWEGGFVYDNEDEEMAAQLVADIRDILNKGG